MKTEDLYSLIEQLQHESSPKRRAAAKKLRKLKVNEAGQALLTALKKEIQDKRTWETQYQMIMALGETQYLEGLDFLYQLAQQDFEALMLYIALGHAITNLELIDSHEPISLLDWISNDKHQLVSGSLRSFAMNQIILKDEVISKIIIYVFIPENIDIQFWAVAAMPGWPKALTHETLELVWLL